jgi:hypothetical protein
MRRLVWWLSRLGYWVRYRQFYRCQYCGAWRWGKWWERGNTLHYTVCDECRVNEWWKRAV